MSYEGYEQCICEKGHYFENSNVYQWDVAEGCDCGAPTVFTNAVDETNGEAYGEIPFEEMRKLKLADAMVETCPCCGSAKTLHPPRYRVPTAEELKNIRYYRASNGELLKIVP